MVPEYCRLSVNLYIICLCTYVHTYLNIKVDILKKKYFFLEKTLSHKGIIVKA